MAKLNEATLVAGAIGSRQAHRFFATTARNACLLHSSQHELFCTVLRSEVSEAYWCFKGPMFARAGIRA